MRCGQAQIKAKGKEIWAEKRKLERESQQMSVNNETVSQAILLNRSFFLPDFYFDLRLANLPVC